MRKMCRAGQEDEGKYAQMNRGNEAVIMLVD